MVTAAVSEQTASHKRSFRNYLIDSRFQLKYAGLLVLVAVVLCSVMGSVLYSTTRSMVEESARVVDESRRVSEESKKVSAVTRMNIRDLAQDSPELLTEFNRAVDAHDRTIAEQQRAIADQQAALIRNQTMILWSLVGGLALLVVLIGALGIYFTHKVAGPVFKMKKLLRQVGEGNLNVEARLRRGDELHDFFDAFTEMIAGLRKFEAKQLAELEAAMGALARGERDDAALSVGRVREAVKQSIDK